MNSAELEASMSDVIHYHGTPIWGNKSEVLRHAVKGAGAFVSYARPDQIKQCLESADSLGIDNGAFSRWKDGKASYWPGFYAWLGRYYFNEKVKFFMIPDVIDGGEEDNDQLIKEVPTMFKDKACPVWHLHESIDRLVRLASEWPRIAFGSSGEYQVIRTKQWHKRMEEAFNALDDAKLYPKIHGLRMLDGRVLGNYPLTTADSTNLACNVPKWRVKYPDIGSHILERGALASVWPKGCKPESRKERSKVQVMIDKCDENELKLHRCAILKGAVESVLPPTRE